MVTEPYKFFYMFRYVLIYTRGYQWREIGQSVMLTKVKGISSSIGRDDLPADYRRIWDPTDFTVTPMVCGLMQKFWQVQKIYC